MMNIHIRRAILADVPVICALSQSLFEHERQFTDEFNMGWSHSEEGRKFFTKRIRSKSSFILVAFDDENAVGYILIKIEKFTWRAHNPIADVGNLSVDPMYRGQGIGTKLFEKARKIAKKRGVKRLSVQALTGNTRAVKFYKTQGFTDFTVAFLMNIE